jgi:hypothetical protein
MPQQTNEILQPYIKVISRIETQGQATPTTSVAIIGFVTDVTGLDPTILETPLDLGTITTVNQATLVVKSLGLNISFISPTQVDMDPAKTDPVAAQVVNFAIAFENYTPLDIDQTLSACTVVLGILDPTVSSKLIAPYGNFLVAAKQNGTIMDTIVPPYEYLDGDEAITGNYFDEIKDFVNERWGDTEDPTGSLSKPVYGMNHVLLANTSWRQTDIVPPSSPLNNHVTCLIYPQGTTGSVYQLVAEQLTSQFAIILTGMQRPYYGFFNQILNTVPLPEDTSTIFTPDTVTNLNQWGFSVLEINLNTKIVEASRILVSLLEDIVTEIPREFMLDFQSWKANYDYKNAIYNRLVSANILNKKFTISKNGNSSVLKSTVNIIYAEAINFAELGIFAIDPSIVSSQFNAILNVDNINDILTDTPFFPSPIIYQMDNTINVKNVATLVGTTAIATE